MVRQFLVAGYTQDGELAGLATSRETLSGWSKKGARFDSPAGAARLADKLERWKTYIWVVEPEPKADVCIPPEPLPLRPRPSLDTINSQPLESAVPATTGPTARQAKSAVADEQGDKMPVKKKKIVKPAAKAATPVPKMKLRTTAAAKANKATASKAAASNGTRRPCLCNCGELSTNFLLRGHWKKVKGYLIAIKAGDAKPEKLFGAKIARAMGPWSPTRGGGQTPKTTDYARIRANLSA